MIKIPGTVLRQALGNAVVWSWWDMAMGRTGKSREQRAKFSLSRSGKIQATHRRYASRLCKSSTHPRLIIIFHIQDKCHLIFEKRQRYIQPISPKLRNSHQNNLNITTGDTAPIIHSNLGQINNKRIWCYTMKLHNQLAHRNKPQYCASNVCRPQLPMWSCVSGLVGAFRAPRSVVELNQE